MDERRAPPGFAQQTASAPPLFPPAPSLGGFGAPPPAGASLLRMVQGGQGLHPPPGAPGAYGYPPPPPVGNWPSPQAQYVEQGGYYAPLPHLHAPHGTPAVPHGLPFPPYRPGPEAQQGAPGFRPQPGLALQHDGARVLMRSGGGHGEPPLQAGIIGELPPELRSAASNGDSGGALLRLLQRNTQQAGPPGPLYPLPRPQPQQAVSQEGSHAVTLAMAGLRVGQPAQQQPPARSHGFTVPAPHFGPPPPDPPARQMWTPPPPVNHGPIGPPAPRPAYGMFASAQQQQHPAAAQPTPPARVPMARTDGAQSAESPYGRSPPASAPRVNQREVRETLAARHAVRAADSPAMTPHARGRGRGRGGGGGGGSLKADGVALSAQLAQLIGTLQPQELDVQRQRACFERVRALVTREWPQAQLLMYGSCANSFGGPSSDVDTCLALPWADRPERKRAVVQRIAQLAQADGGYPEVMALTHARMPVAKLVDARTGVACDVCVNNFLAVFNTRMLRDYAALDPRLRQLGYAVKHWAKRRQVNEPYTGTLSSYCYILMCIHLLQSRQPPVLPVLQSMSHTFNREVEGQQGVTRVGYHDDVQALQGFGARNSESLAQLLHAFFDYWAHRHDYGGAVVCVRTGGLVSKRRKGWTTRVGTERHLICIEDPFEVSHDLGRVVDKRSIGVLRDEFERAERILSTDAQPLEALFAPYVAPNEGSGAQRTGTAHAEDEIEDSQLPDFL